jgi:hypothetical protein
VPGVLGEVPLEPGHGLGVEVVGRLVEEQQVGRAQQQPAQRDAAALAAAQLRDVGVGRRQRSASIAYSTLVSRFQPSDGVDLRLQLGELVGRLVGVVHRQLVEAVEQRAHLGQALLDVAAHVLDSSSCGSCSSSPTVASGASIASPGTRCRPRP